MDQLGRRRRRGEEEEKPKRSARLEEAPGSRTVWFMTSNTCCTFCGWARLVQHGPEDVVKVVERVRAVLGPEADLDPDGGPSPAAVVEAKEVAVVRVELLHEGAGELALPHDGLDLFRSV